MMTSDETELDGHEAGEQRAVTSTRLILVADDDEAMRTTVAFTLLDDGYEVLEAASGAEVLRVLDDARAAGRASGDVDLVIMDIRMPGLSGLETVRKLRELRHPTPVILMTSFASPETVEEAEALDVPLLSKPFPLAELSKLAKRTLRAT